MESNKKFTLIQIISIVVWIIIVALILVSPILFDFIWNQSLRDILPGAENFFRYITELGGTLTYFAIFFVIYWGVDKKMAKSLLFVYVSSNIVNFYAKAIIANPRPDESEWILIGASHLSTPSGHAMSSTVFWGFSALKIKRISMWIASILIIILVGLSRIYLGVHWLGDVLAGWLFGIILIQIVVILEEHIGSFVSKYNIIHIYLGLTILGFILTILTEIFYTSTYNFGTPGGQMMGLGIGFALEHKYVNFEEKSKLGEKWKVVLRVLIGIVIIAVLFVIFEVIISISDFWFKAVQYIVILIIGLFLWPLVFKKIDL